MNGNNAASNSNANVGSRFLANLVLHNHFGNNVYVGRLLHRYRFRIPLGKDCAVRDRVSTPERAKESSIGSKETPMKRARNLFPQMISDANLTKAIKMVCNSHRWDHYPNKPNHTVIWIESHFEECVKDLRQIIEDGFIPSPVVKKRRYDVNAGKWRDIAEPRMWPDQCVHHAMIQVLEPIMMRGMDHWCCGSLKKRGAHYGIRALKKWMGGKKMKYCVECDIRHFYDSLKPELVLNRMKHLIKDRLALDLIWRVIKDGIQIGAYCSQWFANTYLQPLDQLIRQNGATRMIQYMDNFTIFTNRKRTGHKLIEIIKEWLQANGLELKGNWQVFRSAKRKPNALGYRFGIGFVLMRKKNLLRLRRQLKKYYYLHGCGKFIPVKFAQGLLSRLGMLRHCNSQSIYQRYYKKRTQKQLKDIVREYYRKEKAKWSMYLDPLSTAA